jgi:hypothetical protein
MQQTIATQLDRAGRALYAVGERLGAHCGARAALLVARCTVGVLRDILAPSAPCTCGQGDCPDQAVTANA